MKSVQSNILGKVWNWITQNRHNTGINLDIYGYNMHHMTKHASSFSNTSVFAVQTPPRGNSVFKFIHFGERFQKAYSFCKQNPQLSVDKAKMERKRCVFKQKHISVDKALKG